MRDDRKGRDARPERRPQYGSRPQYGGQPRGGQAAHTDRENRRGAYRKPAPGALPGNDVRPAGDIRHGGDVRHAGDVRHGGDVRPGGGRHYGEDGQSRPYGGPRLARGAANVPPATRLDAPAGEAPEPFPPEEQENLLAGRNPIREALKAGRPLEKLLVAAGDLSGAARDIVRMAREAGVIVQTVDRSRLDAIYPAHQGLLAYASMAEYATVEDILDCARERGEDPFVILLDGVTDPHNLGAIIRTAECAGAHGVIIPERRAAGLGPACAKAAAGALDYLRVARVKNLNRTAEELKEAGLWVVATALEGEDVYAADLTGPIALVIGSEGDGVSRLMLEKADRRVTLPMRGRIESLNASVAAGIVIYEVLRARRG